MGGFTQITSEVWVGYGDEFVGPFSQGLAQEPSDAVFGDDCVGEGAGYGDDPTLGELRDDSGYGAAGRRGP